jgi:F-type H+-transporting ATPase subunit b
MPQISQLAATYSSQIFWMLLIFGAVFFLVGRGMAPRVIETMEGRDQRISADLSAAEAARRDADAQDDAWKASAAKQRGEAQALIAAAKAEAAKSTEVRLGASSAEAEVRVAEAEARIAAARDGALAEIETVAADAAADIAARVAGLTAPADAARAAVKDVLHG